MSNERPGYLVSQFGVQLVRITRSTGKCRHYVEWIPHCEAWSTYERRSRISSAKVFDDFDAAKARYVAIWDQRVCDAEKAWQHAKHKKQEANNLRRADVEGE